MMKLKYALLSSVIANLVGFAPLAHAQTTTDAPSNVIQVYAAGSLRAALIKIANEYQDRTGQKVSLTLGLPVCCASA